MDRETLRRFLNQRHGTTTVATADAQGRPNIAGAIPFLVDENTLEVGSATFQRTYENLRQNPKAAFLSIKPTQDPFQPEGIRIYTTLIAQDTAGEGFERLRQFWSRFGFEVQCRLTFRIDEVRELVSEKPTLLLSARVPAAQAGSLKAWLQAARLHMHSIGFAPLMLGSIAAWYEHGVFDWLRFTLATLVGLLLHVATTYTNDAMDVETDRINHARGQFNGGSGVVVEGLLSSDHLLYGTACAVGLALILTFFMILGLGVHWIVLVLFAWGVLAGVGYSLPPLQVAYRGGGELLVLVTYSFALVLAGYFVQAGPTVTALPWALALPIGLAVFATITVTQFPDREPDRQAGKRSLVILLGERLTLKIFVAAIALSTLSVVGSLLLNLIPLGAGAFSLLGTPLALVLIVTALRARELERVTLDRLCAGALALTLWLGLAPTLGLGLERWLR